MGEEKYRNCWAALKGLPVGRAAPRSGAGRLFQQAVGCRPGTRGEGALPGLWKDVPGCGHKAPPFRRDEQQHHVIAPVRTHPRTPRKCPWRRARGACLLATRRTTSRLLLVLTRPELVLRHLLRRTSNPLSSRRAIVTLVQLRVCGEDLDAAADQQRDEQDVEQVGKTDPQRKAESMLLSMLEYLSAYAARRSRFHSAKTPGRANAT
jgi:hypothetical protein